MYLLIMCTCLGQINYSSSSVLCSYVPILLVNKFLTTSLCSASGQPGVDSASGVFTPTEVSAASFPG